MPPTEVNGTILRCAEVLISAVRTMTATSECSGQTGHTVCVDYVGLLLWCTVHTDTQCCTL